MSGAEGWLGRSVTRQDVITDRLVESYSATLSPHLATSDAIPPGLHWCLAPDIVPASDLGVDGHPALGVVLPDLGYGRRMWAGGTVETKGALQHGDTVEKTSTIADVTYRDGRTGKLAILTLHHRYTTRGSVQIEERQTIIYREGSGTGAGAEPSITAPAAEATVELGPTALFRYSALTFNGHRIHYDAPYATGEEGYRGIVVHGPIQATLLLNLAAMHLGHVPASFTYRGHSPLFCEGPFTVRIGETDGGLGGCVIDQYGAMTFSAAVTA